jgi:hypothetical protein
MFVGPAMSVLLHANLQGDAEEAMCHAQAVSLKMCSDEVRPNATEK